MTHTGEIDLNVAYADIIANTNSYYTSKITTYGASNFGVDWNSEESQKLRYVQLSKILPSTCSVFSICDYGCGYGYFRKFLDEYGFRADYTGIDISQAMIDEANKVFPNRADARFVVGSDIPDKINYAVASGIFNVKQDTPDKIWEQYVLSILEKLNDCSVHGFSFNCLTKYSDSEFMKDYLYYPDPCFYFDYCKRNFSKNIALLHDYNLYEFTLLVRK